MQLFLLYLLYYDFFYYFLHRLLHTKELYPIHRIHHQKYIPSYYDYYTIHIVEIPLTSAGLLLAMYFHKVHIYQLLSCIIFINIRGIMAHDARFICLVGDHHLLHHKYFKCNYGEYWLDYIFNTNHTNRDIKEE